MASIRRKLRIVTAAHRTIVVPKGARPRGRVFGKQRSQGCHRRTIIAVGTGLIRELLHLIDIPLQLVIYAQGKTHRFDWAENLAIFSWHFVDGGRRVAFGATTVHFGCAVFWELRDVATERLVAEAKVPEPCGQIPDPPEVKIPKWIEGAVSGIRSSQRSELARAPVTSSGLCGRF